MPLRKGKQNIGWNIRHMLRKGKPYRVARAAALHTVYPRRKRRRK